MKYINFKNVKIRNFLSIGDEPVSVTFRPGIHIITGINRDKEDRRNGVGKSTIADAIYFAVFGNTLRDVKKEHVVNSTTKKGCCVELEVQIQNQSNTTDIRIVRMIEPSKCYIFINGEDKTLDSISNTNNFIQTIFSCTPEIFQNCVIMTINNTIPFMAKKKQEKRQFIEDIFNLKILSDALTLLKADLSDKKKQHEVEVARCEESERGLAAYEKQQQDIVVERTRKKNTLINRRDQTSSDINELQEKLDNIIIEIADNIDKMIEDLEQGNIKIENAVSTLRQQKAELVVTNQQLSTKFKGIGTDKQSCPVCLRNIDEVDKEHIEDEKQKIILQIKDNQTKINEIIEKESQLSDRQKKINAKISELKNSIVTSKLKQQEKQNLQIRIKQLSDILNTINDDIVDIDKTSFNSTVDYTEQKAKIFKLKESTELLRKQLNIIEVSKFVFSEEGVKSVVIKKMLQLFNSKLAYYLKKMDANCTCLFNEYFEEEITDVKGRQCSYFNFSGAERKNIDLACLFTFMDMRRLQGDVCFNFSIYDELFDSSLDERGVDLVINILNERVDLFNESIMVISHRKESIKAANGDIIFLEKKNNITRRVDFNYNNN